MHFSLQQDLTPLRLFLRVLRDEGMTRVTTLMERGDFWGRCQNPNFTILHPVEYKDCAG
jgi:hypothetical protein